MEKLQKALEHARKQRGTSSKPAAKPRRETATSDAAPSAEAPAPEIHPGTWDAIPETELSAEHLNKHRILAMKADAQSTPFDILRTKIQLNMQRNGWRRLAITSPTPSCGKTTTACNLALGFTRQTDMRVILVELDLRRPNIANVLGLEPERDVTSMLKGEIPFEAQALRIRQNVAISAARHSSSDPTAILLSQQAHETLAEIEATYEPSLVIFDLPPLLASDDTRAFLKDVDCALMVARAEATTVAQIDVCEKEIGDQTNVLGVVLNQCRHADETTMGYGDYAYGA